MLVSILSIIIEIATDIILHIFSKSILGIKKKNNFATFGMWLMFFLLTNTTTIFDIENGFINMMIFISSYFIILSILYNGGVIAKIIIVISTYTMGMISEILAVVFFRVILGIDVNIITANVNYLAICNMISKVIWFIFISILANVITRKNKYVVKTSSWLEAFIIPICSIAVIAFIFLDPDKGIGVEEVITITMILAINISTFYLYEKVRDYVKEKMETQYLEQQSKYYVEQYREIEDLWIYMKSFRHDIKNRYILEKSYLDEGQYGMLINEYNGVINDLSKDNKNSNTGNDLIDSIINYKTKICDKYGIQIETNLESLRELSIKSTDISLLLGNLIDNAIEATKQVEDNKKIILNIDCMNNSLSIYVENPFKKSKTIYNKDVTGFDNHIIDLNIIKSIIEKYNGQISIQDEEDKYIVRVFIMS